MRRLLAVSVLSLATIPAALVLAPTRAHACSCVKTPGPVESAQKAGAVFHGELSSVADIPKTKQFELENKAYTFVVVRTFKGNLDPEVKVISAASGAACGRTYGEIGSEWLIYARVDDNGEIHDNLCSRSRPMADAAQDIQELDAAESLDAPAEPPNDELTPDQPDPDPDPILPGNGEEVAEEGGEGGPEPATPSKKGCSTTAGGGSGGLLALLGLGLLARRLRRR